MYIDVRENTLVRKSRQWGQNGMRAACAPCTTTSMPGGDQKSQRIQDLGAPVCSRKRHTMKPHTLKPIHSVSLYTDSLIFWARTRFKAQVLFRNAIDARGSFGSAGWTRRTQMDGPIWKDPNYKLVFGFVFGSRLFPETAHSEISRSETDTQCFPIQGFPDIVSADTIRNANSFSKRNWL